MLSEGLHMDVLEVIGLEKVYGRAQSGGRVSLRVGQAEIVGCWAERSGQVNQLSHDLRYRQTRIAARFFWAALM